MALITVMDTQGRPMLLHTSQFDPPRQQLTGQWPGVWARFAASQTDGTTGPSRVPGGAKPLISQPNTKGEIK